MLPELQEYLAMYTLNEPEMLNYYKYELILKSYLLLCGITKNEFNRK